MRTAELATVYAVIGVLVAATWMSQDLRRRWVDAMLLVPLWPIYAPLLWLSSNGKPAPVCIGGEPAHLEAQIAKARGRLTRIDGLLSDGAFNEEQVLARCDALEDDNNPRALHAAKSRLVSIRRLKGLRSRFADELAAIDEVRAQLKVQRALLELADSPRAELEPMTADLSARAEGLSVLLAEELTLADD